MKRLLLLLTFLGTYPVYATQDGVTFDGNNDYIEIDSVADDLAGLTTFTVEFWMQADKNVQTSIRVGMFSVNMPTQSGDNTFIITMGGLNAQDGKLLIVDNVTGFDFVSTQVIGDNVCHHIAYVRNGATATMYIDGVSVGTHVPNYTFIPTNRYSLGQEWDISIPSDLYEGKMEEVRIWNTARTASQITTNMYNELAGNESGLIAYYPFNQGNPNGPNPGLTFLPDYSPNNNAGTLVNFALSGSVSNWTRVCDGLIPPNGIADNAIAEDRYAYPNPATNEIYVSSTFEKPVAVRITDISGKTVLQETLQGTNPIVDVSALPAGMYFILGEDIVLKFIKE
ncbi:MAG TPA: LamG-like jellyroll fold domain-containing protein [Bacteroidia bacterium]|nr:LamG-like jellyroll fold domain-containing protein [Bacteroidia bacterium]